MNIQKNKNINFGAKAIVVGEKMPENLKNQLTAALSHIGNDSFINTAHIDDNVARVGVGYKTEKGIVNVGNVDIILGKNQKQKTLMGFVENAVGSFVNYFSFRNNLNK